MHGHVFTVNAMHESHPRAVGRSKNQEGEGRHLIPFFEKLLHIFLSRSGGHTELESFFVKCKMGIGPPS